MMGRKTIYCVEPYWYDGRRLARGLPEQHAREADALKAAARLYENHAGVMVWAVTGQPEFDAWSDPRPVLSLGKTLSG